MTTMTVTRTSPARSGRAGARIARLPPSLFDGAGGGPTLDDVIAGVWEGLAVHAVVECPVCDGEMEPEYGQHALPIGGRCRRCGTSLG